ncbi:hypothetical protein HDU83_004812 [Entophlyctis luteolus]|nr:hypothetical protein HDU83_004812 [Entophlyctis luteolus]KAJ3394555.1 hypothetical protein HDU84_007729 [Entophlyctis sp. JEL0112]
MSTPEPSVAAPRPLVANAPKRVSSLINSIASTPTDGTRSQLSLVENGAINGYAQEVKKQSDLSPLRSSYASSANLRSDGVPALLQSADAFFAKLLQDPLLADYSKIEPGLAAEVRARIRGTKDGTSASSWTPKGISPSLRRSLWIWLAGVNLKPGPVHLLKDETGTRQQPFSKIIRQDIGRTFPSHPMFQSPDGEGQKMLYRILCAYAKYDEECGYCQGLSFLVAPLLMQDGMTEKEGLSIFVRLMDESLATTADPRRFSLRSLFTPDMPGLHLILHQHSELVRIYLPALERHLSMLGITHSMYASPWFLTLFTYSLPLHLVFRIYDLILSEGAVSTLLKFSFALLRRNEPFLLSLSADENGFEAGLQVLRGSRVIDVYMGDLDAVVGDAMILDSIVTETNLLSFASSFFEQRKISSTNALEIQTLRSSISLLNSQIASLSSENQILKQQTARLVAENADLMRSYELKIAAAKVTAEEEKLKREQLELELDRLREIVARK